MQVDKMQGFGRKNTELPVVSLLRRFFAKKTPRTICFQTMRGAPYH
jgi:hypothetical protein